MNDLSYFVNARRRRALQLIRERLQPVGECLFVTQFRNSDFGRMRKMANAQPWPDGFLIDSLRGYSFYGLITPERLKLALKRTGFDVATLTVNEGSAYCWATRS